MIDEVYNKNLEGISRKTVIDNTFYYIENYLNPNRKWYQEVPPKERINQIRYAPVYWLAVSAHIKEMDYQSFLKTPYWKAISAHVKYKAGYRCQQCNSPDQLVTHHKDYSIHGYEHARMEELLVLCDDCHREIHNIKKRIQVSNKEEVFQFLNIKTNARFPRWYLMVTVLLAIVSIFFLYFLNETMQFFVNFFMESNVLWKLFSL